MTILAPTLTFQVPEVMFALSVKFPLIIRVENDKAIVEPPISAVDVSLYSTVLIPESQTAQH